MFSFAGKKWRRYGVIALCLLLTLSVTLAITRLWPKPALRDLIPSSVAVYDRSGALLRLTLARDEQYRLWVPLAEIPPALIEAVQLHEDQYFDWHPGVNLWAIVRAAAVTYSGGMRQGGSTLTMQLVRMLYKFNTRTPWGKVKQIALALSLEARYSKAEILEAYFNTVPYGQNIEGAAAASLIYFGKSPLALSLPEVLALAVIPQSPLSRTPTPDAQARLTEARMRLFARWLERHPEAVEQKGLVAASLNLRGKERLPFEAPHLTTMLLGAEAAGAARESGEAITEIPTTLDLRLQKLVERQVRLYLSRAKQKGLNNASVLLVDWTTMEARAWVGSARFADVAIQGQVNGVLGKRSPGSTLKPFIYALALDQGVLHPMTVLKDSPQSFGPFTPENFDGQFAGPITAQQALIRSRNIPAVSVNAHLKSPSLYTFLKNAGVSRMATEGHYGLALTLGGGEVTAEELATLYAMLPNHGRWQPLRTRQDAAPLPESKELLSEEAAFVTLDMLEKNPRPDVAFAGRTMPLPVAWKTGTSWGFRDAWTAGVFGRYVLVVWLGNFDGSSNQALVGAEVAAPLFFNIADALFASDPHMAVARRQPANLTRVDVCQASGDLPNADCPRTVKTWFIPGKSPIKVSELHRAVMVDTRTGKAACPPFDPKYTKREVFEYWPSDLRRLFVQAGVPRRSPPASADCQEQGADVGSAGVAPKIMSPLYGVTYQRRLAQAAKAADSSLSANGNEAIVLQAVADGDVSTLYWFAGTRYLGASSSGKDLIWSNAPPGRHLLRVVDDHGRADTREVVIEMVQ